MYLNIESKMNKAIEIYLLDLSYQKDIEICDSIVNLNFCK